MRTPNRTHAHGSVLKSVLLTPLLLAGAGMLTAPAMAAPKETGEEQLAKLIAGRVAGKPVNCISLSDARDTQVIDRTAIVFGSGSVFYVNRPKDASWLDSSKVLVTKTSTGQLCNVDIVTLRDQSQLMFAGSVALGDFVPYTRAPKPAATGGN